jgi:hypothetical protein
VNFFGHAVVATRLRPAPPPGVVLGSMLPDFLSMCGARPRAIEDADVAAGVALHHETDAAFHDLAPFTGLVRELGEQLTAAGVSRGPMRGTAHVAVELLLDGTLVADPRACDAYLAALDHDPSRGLAFDAEDAARFAFLRTRLRDAGVPRDLARPESVAARCLRMLARRPLLAPRGDEPAAITRVLAEIAPRATVAAPTIMQALRAAMEPSATPGAPWHRGNPAGSSGA